MESCSRQYRDVLVCNNVTPVASYHLKIGFVNPLVSVTEAVGTPTPHCEEGVVVGAFGKGLTVIVNTLLVATSQGALVTNALNEVVVVSVAVV